MNEHMEKLDCCPACNSTNFSPFIQTKAMMHGPLEQSFNFDQCQNCGLVFLNPRVPEERLGEFYTSAYLPYRVEEAWGKYANFVKSDQKKIDWKRVQRVQAFHNITSKSRILDVGCGKPTFLAALRKTTPDTPPHLIGIDFSDEGWANEPNAYKGIDLRKGEVADLKGEPPVDVITMWHYLEHDYRPQEHLRKLLDISHSETRLIIEVPNFDSRTRRKFGENWAGYHTPRHTALYSPENMETLLENSGWQVEKILPYGTLDPFTLHWMSQMEQKGIDWSGSMESRFWGYVRGMVMNLPIYMWERFASMGFLTAVARKN